MTGFAALSYERATVRQLPRLTVARTLCTRDFDASRAKLLDCAPQRSFFRVRADSPIRVGSIVTMRFLLWEFSCRVLSLIDEPHRTGFTYGTLPGHLERGEESFVLERATDGTLTFTVEAHSEPATWWLRVLRPVVTPARQVITRAFYLRSLD